MRRQYTDEVRNLAWANLPAAGDDGLFDYETTGPFWELLAQLDVALAVSREYEHYLLTLGGNGGTPWQSVLGIPHPSGLFWDAPRRELIVSSTRTPNQLFFFRLLATDDFQREIVPADLVPPDAGVFVPTRSIHLPGTLYIHDLVRLGGDIYVTATGHNFLARIHEHGGWERVWWPAVVDGLGRASFDQNYLQLNSIACGHSPGTSVYTGFSDETTGAKPWKAGYGPKGRGVVYDGASRQAIVRDLTCPHSARSHDGRTWLCNSGYGELGHVVGARFEAVTRLQGFTRGLAFRGDYAIVGLSKVIDFYEPYAPGLEPKATRCGVVIVDLRTGAETASLIWPQGYQIYDVQLLPGVTRPLLPAKPQGADDINAVLRYLG